MTPIVGNFFDRPLLAGGLMKGLVRAQVDGFYRFSSFESREAERCQRDNLA